MRIDVNTVKFGVSRSSFELDPNSLISLKESLDTFEKENNNKKNDGQLEEQESDPISFPLFLKIYT